MTVKNSITFDRENLRRQNIEDYLELRSARYRLPPLADFGVKRHTERTFPIRADKRFFERSDDTGED